MNLNVTISKSCCVNLLIVPISSKENAWFEPWENSQSHPLDPAWPEQQMHWMLFTSIQQQDWAGNLSISPGMRTQSKRIRQFYTCLKQLLGPFWGTRASSNSLHIRLLHLGSHLPGTTQTEQQWDSGGRSALAARIGLALLNQICCRTGGSWKHQTIEVRNRATPDLCQYEIVPHRAFSAQSGLGT